MAMDISYDYYKTFYYVARYHSFSAAAAALLCGQPNVTKAIGNLEAQRGGAIVPPRPGDRHRVHRGHGNCSQRSADPRH